MNFLIRSVLLGRGSGKRTGGAVLTFLLAALFAGMTGTAVTQAGTRYAERIILPIKLGTNSEGFMLHITRPTVADMNGDGLDDLVFGAEGPLSLSIQGGIVKILLNNGSGSYVDGTSQLIAEPNPKNVTINFLIEDYNGD